ncbi:DUF5946 family protein [Nonomuraea sp. NPDC050404]|uniref:DUF5946 family protein n=1 Tax=Nonomuraea sp. NPDC050404 TaxID=3155783 RepID=UPI0033ECAFF7
MASCDCGASEGPLGLCADYYHAILAEEQRDPEMYRWHLVVVCVYLLQHPAEGSQKHLDGQFRWLQLYVDQGLEAVLRLQRHQVSRNNHRVRAAYDVSPLEPYEPLPPGGHSGGFRAAFTGLPYGEDGSFVFEGHEAYGNHLLTLAEATLESWTTERPGPPERG